MEKMALSIKEAADRLGVSVSLMRKLVKEGKVPAVRIGERRLVIPVGVLDSLLKE